MLLAAGRAQRMEPLSSLVAKPALEVLGRPLLASAIDHLIRADCERIVVNLHRHPEQVAAAARQAGPPSLLFSREPALLGGAGGVAAARPLLGNGSVLVANADIWADLDLSPLVAAAGADSVTLALLPHPDTSRWASVVLDDAGLVTRFVAAGGDRGDRGYLFTGFQVLGLDAVESLPSPPAEMAGVWQTQLERRTLRGAIVTGRWQEAGSPGAYRDLVLGLLAGGAWMHPTAQVDPGAEVESSAIGAGCRVGSRASIHDSVVTAGATIGPASRLRRCVIAGPLALPPGHRQDDALILPQGCFPLH